VPYHLTTLEFARLVDRSMRADGLYIVNIIDGGQRGQFLRSFVNTLNEVWEYTAVIPAIQGWRETVRSTFVIVASHQPLDLSGVPQSAPPLAQDELADYLAMEPAVILTDDYVPVDNYLAGVFSDSADDFSLDASWSDIIVERAAVLGGGAGALIVAAIAWRLLGKRKNKAATTEGTEDTEEPRP